jgi:LCP family protein required for cell wall assembly
MANGRPTGDGSDRSPDKRRGKHANQEGLAALGRQMRTGPESTGAGAGAGAGAAAGAAAGASVANESGLRALGARIDSAGSKSKGRRSGKPKWSATKKTVVALCSLIVLIAAVVGGGYAYVWYRYNQINKVHINAEVAAANGAPFTILVIGSDSRVGESSQAFGSSSVVTGQRSDVVQLWRVTPSTKQIQIISIPRDTVVSMLPPDNSQFGTYNRINSSFNSGADQLVKTITANFGIPINHVVQVDFAGFQDAVNALGGIYLNFPYPAKDSYSGLNITTPGCQLLNGAQALAVARARHYEYYSDGYWQYDGTSDFGRIERQDVFIRSLITSAKSKVNPLTVNAFIGSIHEGVTIDDGFGINELIGLALDYRSFDPGALQAQTLPTEAANDFGDLGDVLTVQQPEAQQMLVNTFGSDLTAPTNPPPDTAGDPNPPPTITPTTVAPPSPTTAAGKGGSSAGSGSSSGATTTTTTAPPSFNPTPCTPS